MKFKIEKSWNEFLKCFLFVLTRSLMQKKLTQSWFDEKLPRYVYDITVQLPCYSYAEFLRVTFL